MEKIPPLTISIPTYNRPKQLAATLERLLPQVNENWVLAIIDNCSTPAVEEVHREMLARFGPGKANVIRNRVNVGLSANIMRCFEYCETEWLVCLADDDQIEPDFVESFLSAIQQHPDIVFATFSSTIFTRETSFFTNGLADFCKKLDNWSNLLFLPCGLYKRNAFVPFLRYGYHYAYTLGPQLAVLLQCLKEGEGKCLFSSKKVVTYLSPETGTAWSDLHINMMAFLLEIIPKRESQLAFFDQMEPYSMKPKQLAFKLIDRSCATGEDSTFAFDIRSLLLTRFRCGTLDLVRVWLLRVLVSRPQFGAKFVQFVRKLKGMAPRPSSAVDKDLLERL